MLGIPKFFFQMTQRILDTDLVTMNIKTGDSPPISQKPYNLSLKHTAWVQKELETLEKTGVIA